MKKFEHPVDDLFREALRDHQTTPSEEAKKAFLAEALKPKPPAVKLNRGMILLILLLLSALTGGILWLTLPDDQGVNAPTTSKLISSTSLATPEASNPENTAKGTTQAKSSPSYQIEKRGQEMFSAEEDDITAQAGNKEHQPVLPENEPLESNPTTDQDMTMHGDSTLKDLPSQPIMEPYDTTATSPVLNPVTAGKPDTSGQTKPEKRQRTQRTIIPAIGIFFTPEWMFNTLESTNFISNFGLEAEFRYGPFAIRTGAGLSIGKGTHELLVEYNDFLGDYTKLDSMSFTWNNQVHDYVPTMYTSKKDVYDTAIRYDRSQVVKRYTYLQIPLALGYDFIRRERWSAGVRVGPVLSVLLSSKQLSAAYDPGTKQVISMNDISPGQISLNWQVMAGFPVGLTLNDRFRIELEPEIRYYFNAVYEKPAGETKPWSAGLRAAFMIKW